MQRGSGIRLRLIAVCVYLWHVPDQLLHAHASRQRRLRTQLSHLPLPQLPSFRPIMLAAAADVDSHLSVAWGIVVGLIASCVQSLGLTMQRKSHVLNEQLSEREQRVDYKRP